MIIILEFIYSLVSPFPIWIQFLVYYILFYILSFLIFYLIRTIEIYFIVKSKDHYLNVSYDPLTMKKVILRSLFMALDLTVIVIIGYIRNYLK